MIGLRMRRRFQNARRGPAPVSALYGRFRDRLALPRFCLANTLALNPYTRPATPVRRRRARRSRCFPPFAKVRVVGVISMLRRTAGLSSQSDGWLVSARNRWELAELTPAQGQVTAQRANTRAWRCC